MSRLSLAVIKVHWQGRAEEQIPVQYNPAEYTLDKQVQLAEAQVPGLDAPLQQFVRGQAEKLTLDLFFDTTDQGMGAGAHSVAHETDKVYQLIKIEPRRHAPPVLEFVWGEQGFPGSQVGAPAGARAAQAQRAARSVMEMGASAVGGAAAAAGSAAASAMSAAGGATVQNQRRTSFKCVMESIKQKFTLFSPEGVPLRATLTVTLREYRPLEQQLREMGLNSPDRTHVHVLQQGDDLARVAHTYWGSVAEWREIADANRIDDPRRLTPGRFLRVPRLR